MSWSQIQTYLKLGLVNIVRVASYRLKLKVGYFRLRLPVYKINEGRVFPISTSSQYSSGEISWSKSVRYFGWYSQPVDRKPDWFFNPLNGKSAARLADRHWTRIPDFSDEIGDIKTIWEVSRFGWALDAAIEYRSTSNPRCVDKLNRWMNDWIKANPPNQGPNWKCGQETAIRVIHLLATQWLLCPSSPPSESLEQWLKAHCRRILPTMSYAIGQANNHAITEAVSLYLAGMFLSAHGRSGREAMRWQKVGRKLLIDRVSILIEEDGTFSQYSVNYHRLMLDAISFAEYGRRRYGDHQFPELYQERILAAISWLDAFIEKSTGDVPNIGANDGAQLFQLQSSEYRDFRPCIAFASRVFSQESRFALNVDPVRAELIKSTPLPKGTAPINSSALIYNGFATLPVSGGLKAFFRYPYFQFRPSQADVHHVDVWRGSDRLFVDAGTYSYNAASELADYFPSTGAHNTAEFDGRNQMPRISRFLFGGWIQSNFSYTGKSNSPKSVISSYMDSAGAGHERQVEVSGDEIRVTDRLFGSFRSCIIRWRTPHMVYQIGPNYFTVANSRVRVDSDASMTISIEKGWESLYYMHYSPVNVLTIKLDRPARVTTDFWAS